MSELSAEQTMAQLWEEHMRHEFQTCSTEDTLATMVEDAYGVLSGRQPDRIRGIASAVFPPRYGKL